jgi:hypothetical protein
LWCLVSYLKREISGLVLLGLAELEEDAELPPELLPLTVIVELTVTVETWSHAMSSGSPLLEKACLELTLPDTVVVVAVTPQQEHALE